jgi:hypothetical protein
VRHQVAGLVFGLVEALAKKENRAKRLRKKRAKAALLAETRRHLWRLAMVRRRRVHLAKLEVKVLELRAINNTLQHKRSHDDGAPGSVPTLISKPQ